jgi:uncharacterized membrane protein YhaH (DUF805 family)
MQKEESRFNMIDWWKKVVFENYANFNGRARRAEYWNFALCNLLSVVPFYVLGFIGAMGHRTVLMTVGFGLYGIYLLAMIVPSLAVAVRRLHDINKSGWAYFIVIIPLIGPIILLVWFFTEGTRGRNSYGPDSKAPQDVVFDFEQPKM